MSLYVLCVLGGMALSACLRLAIHYIGERIRDRQWEREQREVEREARRAGMLIVADRGAVRDQGWDKPAVKGFERTMTPSQQREFLRACVRAHEERKHES